LTNQRRGLELNSQFDNCFFNKENVMAKVCSVSGAHPTSGRKYKRRGMARRKGGAGSKIVGKTLRVIKPNLQRVKIVDANGTVKHVWVTARMLKAGKVNKAPKASLKRANAAAKKA
jgi:large subunit ribosomal protein L28